MTEIVNLIIDKLKSFFDLILQLIKKDMKEDLFEILYNSIYAEKENNLKKTTWIILVY